MLSAPENCTHSYYKYYVNVAADRLAGDFTRDDIVRCLQAEGIPCGSGMCCEIYNEKAIAQSEFAVAKPLPNAKQLGERSIMFMVHPTLSESDMEDIVAACEKVMRNVNSAVRPMSRAA